MNQEQNEVDLLTGKGFDIKTKIFGKERVFITKKMSIGRLIEMSGLYLKMEVDEDVLDSDNLQKIITENYKSVHKNGKNAAKVLAIAVSDNKIKRWFLTRSFLKNIDTQELYDYALKLFNQSNYKAFMLSIALMNGNRITKPQTIEKTKG